MVYYAGSWEYSGGNGMQVAMDVTWSAVSHTSSTVVATVKFYTDNQYSYSDNQTLNISNNLGSNESFNNNDGTSEVLRATRTYTHTYTSGSYGTSPGNVTFSATIEGAYNGVTPTVSESIAIPARPAGVPDAPVLTATVPAAPTGVSQINLSWTTPDNQGSALDGYTLQRSTTSSTTGFSTIFTDTAPLTTSYNDTGLTANTQHWYKILASNGVGNSAYSTVVTGTTLGGIVRVWNGTAYVTANAKVWNGTAWVSAQVRIWNGTEWKYGI